SSRCSSIVMPSSSSSGASPYGSRALVVSGGGGGDGGCAGSYGTGATEASVALEACADSLTGVGLLSFVPCDAVPLVDGVAPVWARGSSVGMLTVRPGQPDGPSA